MPQPTGGTSERGRTERNERPWMRREIYRQNERVGQSVDDNERRVTSQCKEDYTTEAIPPNQRVATVSQSLHI